MSYGMVAVIAAAALYIWAGYLYLLLATNKADETNKSSGSMDQTFIHDWTIRRVLPMQQKAALHIIMWVWLISWLPTLVTLYVYDRQTVQKLLQLAHKGGTL